MFEWMIPLLNADGDIGASSSETGVDTSSAAETQATPHVEQTSEPGVDQEVAAEPGKQNNFEKAFAKRLSEAQSKWEAEAQEKYKGHDDFKYLADYLQESNGMDVMTLKEQIELERLNARADKEQVSPEVIRRIDELEAKAAKGDALEQQVQEEQRKQTYFTNLADFVKEKGVAPEELNQFMLDNDLMYNPSDMNKSFNVALRAMKAEEFEKKAAAREEEVISKYLASKQAPKVDSPTGAAALETKDTSKMSWKDLTRHAAGRIEASKTAQ